MAWAPPAAAVCREPLSRPELRHIDALAVADPMAAIDAATAALATPSGDLLRRAGLHTVIADAYVTIGDDTQALRSIRSGREALAALAPAIGVESLQLRLELLEATTAHTRVALEAAMRSLDGWAARSRRRPLGHACLLLVRSRVGSRLALHERAASDGLQAHQLAVESGDSDAIEEAAFQLATTFRRAGLLNEALQYADESLAHARASAQPAAISNALYVKAQVLDESGQHEAALATGLESRRISVDLRDDGSRAFADHHTCDVLIELHRPDEAEAYCTAAEKTFYAMQRHDIVAGTLGLRARIDLAKGRPAVALTRLDRALADDGNRAAPDFIAQLLRERSNALAALGRYDEAFASLRRGSEMADESLQRRRSLAVALQLAQREQERRAREHEELTRELLLARQKTRNEELSRQLAYGLLAGCLLALALLAFLLTGARRHARVLRRQEAELRATAKNLPDALVLLDGRGRVRFASRALIEGTSIAVPGQLLLDSVPPEVRPVASAAVDDLLLRRVEVGTDFRVATSAGPRDYELRGLPIVERGELLGATLRVSDVSVRRSIERAALDIVRRENDRMGDDLHEGLGQDLAGIALQLGAVAMSQRRGRPLDVGHVEEALAQLGTAIGTTRNLALRLAPLQIERGSLAAALARLASVASRPPDLEITFRSMPGEIDLPREVAQHLHAIVETVVSSLARQRGPRRVVVELAVPARAAQLTLDITTDGDAGTSVDPDCMQVVRYLAGLAGASVQAYEPLDGATRIVVTISGTSAVSRDTCVEQDRTSLHAAAGPD